ncbi:MAG: hypothetical protein GX030_03410 [Firmicutes bacterium]|nr:hypothetical protein [Bacillota bacterium]
MEACGISLLAAIHRLEQQGVLSQTQAEQLSELLEQLDQLTMAEMQERIEEILGS